MGEEQMYALFISNWFLLGFRGRRCYTLTNWKGNQLLAVGDVLFGVWCLILGCRVPPHPLLVFRKGIGAGLGAIGLSEELRYRGQVFQICLIFDPSPTTRL